MATTARARPPKAPASDPRRGRPRLMPTSVLGLSVLVLAFALGAGFSGAVFYSYYDYKLKQNQDDVEARIGQSEEAQKDAVKAIETARDDAKGQVQQEIEPLKKFTASGDTLQAAIDRVKASVFFVTTLDDNGQPSVGTAFVAFSDQSASYLLTSFTTVEAATVKPGPAIKVRQGTTEATATLYSWDEANDLALLVLNRGSVPRLSWAKSPATKVGDRVLVMGGLGTQGAAATQGFIADVSAQGIQHSAPVGTAFQGGPMLNSDFEVIGVASRTYSPLGFVSDSVWFGVPVQSACSKVVKCPSGDAAAAGTAGA